MAISPSSNSPRPTYAEIDLEKLRSNFRSARKFIGDDVKYMAVVKADAYGHGAVECARVLEDEGIDWLGVALVEEAIELREADINSPILCLGGFFAGQERELIQKNITTVVFNKEQIELLDRAAGLVDRKIPAHVKIDTGMGRLGVRWDEVARFINKLETTENLEVEALMTHFAAADDPLENAFTDLQIERFYDVVAAFEAAGIGPKLVDLANSPGAVAHPRSRPHMVRLGGILYGLGHDIIPRDISQPKFKPVMSLYSEIADIKRVSKGESLGYGRTFVTGRDSLVGLVPIGYHDGYRRGFSNKALALINGLSAPVVGRISMDWTIVDLTDATETKIGDKVTLMGIDDDRSVSAEDLAGLIDTISYEITCAIGSRVPRIYRHTK